MPHEHDAGHDAGADASDVFEDALGSIFGLSQPAEGTAHAQLAFAHPALPRQVHFEVPDVAAANAKIAAQYQWASGRTMAQLLADPLDVRGRAVLELGSGTGLPSLVVAQLGARLSLATDYPDETLLACLAANVARNRSASASASASAGGRTGVQALLWGDAAQMQAARAFNDDRGYDLILCSDVLWMSSAHDSLLAALLALLAPEGRVLIISGLHTGRRPVATFLTLAAKAGLVPDWHAPALGVWERFHSPGGTAYSVPWRGHPDLPRFDGQSLSLPEGEHDTLEPEYDDRAHWSICALLRRG